MDTTVKKAIRLLVYGFLAVLGIALSLIPFLKKKEFSNDFSADVREAQADIPSASTGDGDADDGGGI